MAGIKYEIYLSPEQNRQIVFAKKAMGKEEKNNIQFARELLETAIEEQYAKAIEIEKSKEEKWE